MIWNFVENSSKELNLTNEDIKMDKFKETRPLSSYLWTVNVGDFLVQEYNDFKIPMRLMARKGNLYPCSA